MRQMLSSARDKADFGGNDLFGGQKRRHFHRDARCAICRYRLEVGPIGFAATIEAQLARFLPKDSDRPMASDLLSIAASGAEAARGALDVTAQNIANASTDGYVRRDRPAGGSLRLRRASGGSDDISLSAIAHRRDPCAMPTASARRSAPHRRRLAARQCRTVGA